MKYMKYLPLLLLVSAPAFASDTSSLSGFIDWVKNIFADVDTFFATSLPGVFQRALAFIIEYAFKIKLYCEYQSVVFSYGVAKQISADLQLSQYLSSAVSALPPDLKYVLNSWQVPNAINFILNCFITRFVMNFMGW